MKNKITIILVFITLLLVTNASAQTNYSFSIADILSSMPNGKRLPDGTIVKAELITTGGATHSTGASGSGTAGPDIGGLFTGITLPAYVGDKTPTNFTKIQMANTLNADNGMGNNCSASIGFRIYFDRPIESINFLALDIDGVHGTPNGNAEWVAFFGYNGNTFVPYGNTVSTGNAQLINQSINIGANHSWRNLITNSLGTTAGTNLPSTMTIRRQTVNGGPGTPDDLNHQVLFTPPLATTHVTDFFLMTGIWSVTGQANVQASGLSPIVITISSDFGDAPDSYKTLLASGGASHGVVGTLSLGDTNFAEPDGLPSVLADASIDDDGVQVIPPLTNNGQTISSYTIAANFNNNSGLPANYAAWIDWNNDGVFQASEGTTATSPAGTLSGTVNLTWNNVALTNTAGHAHTYLRVRVTTEAITTADSGSSFIDGEVEDYAIGLPATTPDFACFNVGTSSGFINVLANDTTGNTIVPETVGFVDPGTGTNLIVDGFGDLVGITIPGEGVWKANSAGLISFEPASASVINPTPIAYLGRDAQGNISNSALITLTAASIPVNTTTVSEGCFPITLTATASVPTGQTVVWYDAPLGGNIVASPVLSTVGTITYYAQGNNGTCTSSVRTPVALTVTAPPNPGTLSGSQSICQGTAVSYTTDGDAGGIWSSSDPTIATVDSSGIVTGIMPGTVTITYTAIGTGSCANVAATRIITIEDAPESGNLSGNQDICVGGTSAFTTDGPPGGVWLSNNPAIATVDVSTGVVTGVSRGTTTIRYTALQVGSCAVIPSLISVNIIESNPGTLSGNQNVCVGETTAFTTDGDSGGIWSTNNAGVASVDANGVITGIDTGTAIITYTVNGSSGCPSASTTRTVTVNVNAPATAADITGTDTDICPGDTATLSVSSVTVINPVFTWYTDQTTSTVLHTGASYSVSPSVTTTYYVSVKGDAVCENDPNARKTILVTVNTLGLATDITASDATICLGSAVSLTASSSTVTTPVFRWYADQTTTTVLSTGASYNPSPTVTTTYYVSVSGDGVCENAINTRKPVVVNVTPLATQFDLTANNQTICNGSSVLLTASSSNVISPVFRWYADQTSTTVLNTGPSYNVSPLTTTTYYVSVSGTGMCENLPNTRKAVTANVNPLGQASDITALDAVTCPGQAAPLTASSTTVTSPIFRWYADQTTTTVLSTGASYSPSPTVTTTYYVSVSGTGVCENAPNTRKAVTISMNPLATAADINTLDQTICAGDTALLIATSAIDSPVFIWYESQTSTNPLFVGDYYDPTPTITTTYYVSVRGTDFCDNAINTRKAVTVTVNSLGLASDITAADATICTGSSASLTASSATVTTPVFTWYADQTTTTALSTGASYSPSPTATTIYYVSVSGDGVCENLPNTRKAVTVTVNSLGLASDITAADATICSGSSASLTASSATVTTPVFRWYADQTTTTALSTGASYSPSPIATTTYYVSVSGDGVCENLPNTRKPVIVTVNSLGLASDITAADATICSGSSASLTASSATVTTPVFRWYADQIATTALSTGASYSPSPTATTTYYVSVSGDGVCENLPGTRQLVTVTVNSLGLASDITAADAAICSGSSASLTASSATVITPVFRWYADQTTTTVLSTGASYNPSPTATTTYYVSVSGDGVCENLPNTRKAVAVTVNSLGLASDITAADAAICSGSSASLTASSATVTTPVFRWYADQTTTTVLSTGASYNPSPTITTTYYVSVSGDGVCENLPNTRKAVTVTVNSLGLASDITAADATICSGSSASLTASSATVTTPVFRWYADQTTTAVLSTGASYNPSPTITTTYYVSVSGDGVCENLPNTRKAVAVTVNSLGLASDITAADATICSGSSASLTASSTTVTTPVFRWYADQTTTAVLSTGASYNPSPTATTTYYVSVSGDGVCENLPNTRKAVAVTVNSLGLASDITAADATICSGTSASLTASSATVTTPVFRWYADQTATAVLSTGASYNPSPTATTTYYVSVSGDGVCENLPNTRKPVIVTVNSLGLASDITAADATICTGSSASLTASSATVITPFFRWYADQTTTTALSTGASYSPSPIATTTYYVSVSGDGVCENLANTRKPVIVTVNSLGLASDITAADATICSGSSASLTASSATVTSSVFRWYADQTTMAALSTGASYSPSPTITTTYYVSVSGDGVCENLPNTRKAVTVTVNSLGLASDITAADATICSGSSASLTASSAMVATPVFRWYADQTTTAVLNTGASYSVSPTITTTYYVSVSGDGVCENLPNTRKPVIVTVNSLGLASDITAADATICSGASASLTASSATVTTPVFRWYADQTTTAVLSTGASYNPSPTITTTYYVSVSGDGVCENLPNTRKVVTVNVNPLAQASDINALDTTSCPGEAVTLSVSSTTVTTPIFRWYPDQTTTTALSTGVSYSSSPTVTTTYYVSVSGDGVCENLPNTRKAVTVNVNSLGLASDIVAVDATICTGSSASLTVSSATVTTPIFRWYADQTTTTVLSTGASYGPSPTVTTTYYVSVSGDGVCENLPNTRKPVTVTVNSLAIASDITVDISNASICTGGTSTITASSTISDPIFNWYQDSNLSVLLYTGAVFVTPSLTANTSYYVTVQNNAICENSLGNALKVDINVILCSDIALTKTVSNLSPYVGDQINFTITVTNFGPDDATGVSANDVLPSGYTFISAGNGGVFAGNTITWPVLNLTSGASTQLTYIVKINPSTGATDEYKNVAQIITSDNFDPNSTPNNNDPTENDQDSVTVTPIVPMPSIQVLKDGAFTAANDTNEDGFPEEGETVTYTFSVKNTGNIRLENVKINDSYIGVASLAIVPSTLDPGQTGNAQVTYTITQTDIQNGVIYNSALGEGNTPPTADDPDGTVVNDTSTDPTNPSTPGDPYYDPACPDCTVVPLPNNPKIAIVKEIASFSGDLNNAKVGDIISYLFIVTNTGNAVLTNVKVTDPMPGLSTPSLDPADTANSTGDLNGNGSLDLNEKWLYRANYTITASDVAKGKVVNQALAEATGPPTPVDPTGKDVSDLSDGSSPTGDEPTVLDIKGCQVIAHNALSPNGDSKNDIFKIDGIECYPQNTVEIYNRWGVIVFHTNGYDNTTNAFNGYSNGRAVVKQSAGLPTGTYYYIIKYVDSDSKEQSSAGYLYLSMQ